MNVDFLVPVQKMDALECRSFKAQTSVGYIMQLIKKEEFLYTNLIVTLKIPVKTMIMIIIYTVIIFVREISRQKNCDIKTFLFLPVGSPLTLFSQITNINRVTASMYIIVNSNRA